MTTAQVVETSVTVNNNSPIQDYVHPDDQTQPTFEKQSYKYTETCMKQTRARTFAGVQVTCGFSNHCT